jgi:hypothetical protein
VTLGLLGIHWPTTTEGWALLASLVALAGSALTFALAELRRWERVSIKVNFNYRIKLERDTYLYSNVVRHQNLRDGERCCLLTVKYRGRHSVNLRAAYFEVGLLGLHPFNPDMTPGVLYDGQSKRVLLAERMFNLDHVTAFAIETASHGVRLKHVRRFLRYQHRHMLTRPGLFSVLQWITGVPEVARASAMNPKRCPQCRTRSIDIIADTPVPTDPPSPFQHRNRRFKCRRGHEWSADSVEPVRVEPEQPAPEGK